MKIVKITQVKPNPKNPRVIKDIKFKKLVQSIIDFPDMLNKRPLVVFTDVDNKYVVLGGNMRLKALNELKYKEVPVIIADEWNEEQKTEFLIKDNVGFGEWDYDMLANEWDIEALDNWGLSIPNFDTEDLDIDKFFEESETEKNNSLKIVLEYSEEDYNEVMEAFNNRDGSKESIVYNLLGLNSF